MVLMFQSLNPKQQKTHSNLGGSQVDKVLHEKLKKWHSQIEKIKPIEARYLSLEGQEKVFLAKLITLIDGKSYAERESKALASDDWKDFKEGLAAAKAEYLDAKRVLELKIKAYEAEYITFKVEAEAIKRAS